MFQPCLCDTFIKMAASQMTRDTHLLRKVSVVVFLSELGVAHMKDVEHEEGRECFACVVHVRVEITHSLYQTII